MASSIQRVGFMVWASLPWWWSSLTGDVPISRRFRR
jgi:hypothetical protein